MRRKRVCWIGKLRVHNIVTVGAVSVVFFLLLFTAIIPFAIQMVCDHSTIEVRVGRAISSTLRSFSVSKIFCPDLESCVVLPTKKSRWHCSPPNNSFAQVVSLSMASPSLDSVFLSSVFKLTPPIGGISAQLDGFWLELHVVPDTKESSGPLPRLLSAQNRLSRTFFSSTASHESSEDEKSLDVEDLSDEPPPTLIGRIPLPAVELSGSGPTVISVASPMKIAGNGDAMVDFGAQLFEKKNLTLRVTGSTRVHKGFLSYGVNMAHAIEIPGLNKMDGFVELATLLLPENGPVGTKSIVMQGTANIHNPTNYSVDLGEELVLAFYYEGSYMGVGTLKNFTLVPGVGRIFSSTACTCSSRRTYSTSTAQQHSSQLVVVASCTSHTLHCSLSTILHVHD